jgi:hypothetical protein
VNKFENGTVSLNVDKKYVEENCEFEWQTNLQIIKWNIFQIIIND